MGVISFCAKAFLLVVSLIVTSTVFGPESMAALFMGGAVVALIVGAVIVAAKIVKFVLAYWRKLPSGAKRTAPLVFIFGSRGSESLHPYTWLSAIGVTRFSVVPDAVPKTVEKDTEMPTGRAFLISQLLASLYYHRDAKLLAARESKTAQIAEKSKANCIADAIYAYVLGFLTGAQFVEICSSPWFDDTASDCMKTKQSSPRVVMVYCSTNFEDCCRNIVQRDRSRLIEASQTKMETFVYAYVMLELLARYEGVGFIDDVNVRARASESGPISFESGRANVEMLAKNNMEILMTHDQANRFKKVVELFKSNFIYFGKAETGVLVRPIDREIDNQVKPIDDALEVAIHNDKKKK